MAVQYSDYKDAFDKYREYQNKFDYFFLAIIVGALSISIQSYKPVTGDHSIYLMATTWILLAISFVSGLIRRERILNFMRVESEKITYELKEQNYQQILQNLRIVEATEENSFQRTATSGHLRQQSKLITYAQNYLNILGDITKVLYHIQKYTFIGGLLAFGLFKMTNIYHFTKFREVTILIIYAIVSFIMPFVYRYFIKTLKDFREKKMSK